MTRLRLERNLTLSVFTFFLLHSVASVNDWYRSLAWIDIPVHFLGGVLVAAVFYWFFQRFPSHFDTSRNFLITLIMVLSFTALAGVFWEFTEYIYDLLIAKYGLGLKTLQFGLRDTLGDLLADLAGGLVLAIFVKLRYHR
ncbi:MAG: hypothetical protein COT89_02165 [Candidatus Colwellbacteria bacterium CG10_big_fil_rev_8_21_14_0_10_42_22]|uniref:VanZ-like domain-containing protein n=1 Tax=Candidatus Colwellbacteria bacterium CG10_big_fil_rev_8_21_14_0_10_42_22 TaxID=1974540 RepID=A0A2H0VFL0_9BACT|nr:MAG: hypothetical protein COT89_02165 [Candidatus Colwellbacteria bacterium CG10_big_fil_rev_8_21_14_0_10_42_22]